MKFIFSESFPLSDWNGKEGRFSRGISGSHNGIAYLAEGLARDNKHDVEVVSIYDKVKEDNYLNVQYTNFRNFEPTECDYIIISPDVYSLTILDKITSYKKIIMLTHNHLNNSNYEDGGWRNLNKFFTVEPNKMIIAYISEFAKTNLLMEHPFLNNYSSILLYNSIDINDIHSVNISEKENKLCFFACLNRGYKMVEHIVDKLDDYGLYASTYHDVGDWYTKSYIHNNGKIVSVNNASKSNIFKYIAKSKYFVYPLINLDDNIIHYDTFAYCVLEALLHGTIVIVPRKGVFEELYGDAICYIDTDDIIPKDDLLYWYKDTCTFENPKCANPNFGFPIMDKYIEKIKILDNDEELRHSYIQKGLLLKEKFSNNKISDHLLQLLDDSVTSKETSKEKTILTVFAGREANLRILMKYLQKALERNMIDEVHLWNYTRNESDERYLKSISNLKRTSSTDQGNYVAIHPAIVDQSFDINIRASNDIHIRLSNNVFEYEIVLGGWWNTKSVIRENGNEIGCLNQIGIADGSNPNTFKFKIIENHLYIFKKNEVIMSQKLINGFEIEEIYFKTGFGAIGHISYETTQNRGIYFMEPCEKQFAWWKCYYQHYAHADYENDVILKCDDDIVFIDLNKLPEFIQFVKNSEYDLIYANTINNPAAAYYQQHIYGLIPEELMIIEPMPIGKVPHSLWESGEKAEKLHNYFIENYRQFLDREYNKEVIQINYRYSINFFGYKGKNWHKIIDCYHTYDDEQVLSLDYVIDKGFVNVLYSDFYVSHLSFCLQHNNMNIGRLIYAYGKLFTELHEEYRKNEETENIKIEIL